MVLSNPKRHPLNTVLHVDMNSDFTQGEGIFQSSLQNPIVHRVETYVYLNKETILQIHKTSYRLRAMLFGLLSKIGADKLFSNHEIDAIR